MRLLIDSDAFCKFAAGGILGEALAVFGAKPSDCARLVALPHMLRRGRLRRWMGDTLSDQLIPIAEQMSAAPVASDEWLDHLVPLSEVDPGEAQLLAIAAERGTVLITGDKRSLQAIKGVPVVQEALQHRVAVVESVLAALCDVLGKDELRTRLSGLHSHDNMIKVCFSSGNTDPKAALMSYVDDVRRAVSPLTLWEPP